MRFTQLIFGLAPTRAATSLMATCLAGISLAATSLAASSATSATLTSADATTLSSTAASYDFSTASETKIFASDGSGSIREQFGAAVALSNDLAIVGSPNALVTQGATLAANGAAYVFDAATGAEIQKLAMPSTHNGHSFGEAVAISGTTAVVGATGWANDASLGSGSGYVFDATTGELLSLLKPGYDSGNIEFGSAVAISGDTVVVGAYGDDTIGAGAGAAYVFDAKTGARIAKLFASDARSMEALGYSVGVSGNTVIAGAPRDNHNGNYTGSAYLFDATTGAELAKLTATDAAQGDQFGTSVAISGDIAIVGSPYDDDMGSNSGSAYLFDATTGEQLMKLTAPDGAATAQFGRSVSISGDLAIIGTNYFGAAYVFDTVTGALVATLTTPGDGWFGFGNQVAISGDNALIGAHLGDGRVSLTGSAMLYGASGQSVSPVPLPAGIWLLSAAAGMLVASRTLRR